MRIVALADSLALPRIEGQDVLLWEDTWPHRLEEQLRAGGCPAEVVNCAARTRTVDSLCREDFTEHIVFKRPDAVIVQVGIVDCAPRIVSLRERRVLNAAWFPAGLRRWIVERRTRRRAKITARNPLARVYTPPPLFATSLEAFRARVASLDRPPRLLVAPILSNRPRMEEKSPGHSGNVDLYNSMLESFCRLANATWLPASDVLRPDEYERGFLSDGYHLSAEGSRRLSSALSGRFLAPGGASDRASDPEQDRSPTAAAPTERDAC